MAISKAKLKPSIEEANECLKKISAELKALSINLKTLMRGDEEGAYWNGKDACEFYKVAKANVQNDVNEYINAKSKLNELGKLYELVDLELKK